LAKTVSREDRRAREKLQMLEGALDYKLKWKAEIARCTRLGIEVPRPLPEPEDIMINFRTGEVKTDGPLDERERGTRSSWPIANRSYREGASKAGKTLQEMMADRQRPKAKRRWQPDRSQGFTFRPAFSIPIANSRQIFSIACWNSIAIILLRPSNSASVGR
jgi:hypothetical protein